MVVDSLIFPGDSDGKESACNVGDLGSIPELETSLGGGYGKPLQYSCLKNSREERSLMGYMNGVTKSWIKHLPKEAKWDLILKQWRRNI